MYIYISIYLYTYIYVYLSIYLSIYIAVARWWECLSLEPSLNTGRVGRGANIKDSLARSLSLSRSHSHMGGVGVLNPKP